MVFCNRALSSGPVTMQTVPPDQSSQKNFLAEPGMVVQLAELSSHSPEFELCPIWSITAAQGHRHPETAPIGQQEFCWKAKGVASITEVPCRGEAWKEMGLCKPWGGTETVPGDRTVSRSRGQSQTQEEQIPLLERQYREPQHRERVTWTGESKISECSSTGANEVNLNEERDRDELPYG